MANRDFESLIVVLRALEEKQFRNLLVLQHHRGRIDFDDPSNA